MKEIRREAEQTNLSSIAAACCGCDVGRKNSSSRDIILLYAYCHLFSTASNSDVFKKKNVPSLASAILPLSVTKFSCRVLQKWKPTTSQNNKQ